MMFLLAKWNDGTFTFFFGENEKTIGHALDKIGDPSDAEVREIPVELMREVTLNQKGESDLFQIDVDVEYTLWRESRKQIWPPDSSRFMNGPN